MNPDAPEASSERPRAPSDLPKAAKRIFRDLVQTLEPMNLASRSDTEKLTMLAYRLWLVKQCRTVIETKGLTYESETQTGVMIRARPEVAILNESMRHADKLLSDFGLDPASRTRLKVQQKKKATNPFTLLMGGA